MEVGAAQDSAYGPRTADVLARSGGPLASPVAALRGQGRTRAALLLGLLLLAALVAVQRAGQQAPPVATGVSYHVSPTGSDDASGTSPSRAWRSLERASAARLLPGDRLLLERGGVWVGGLVLSSSGSPSAPVVVAGYGRGDRPLITGGQRSACVRVDGDHVVVEGLDARTCGYVGFDFWGDAGTLRDAYANGNAVGVKVSSGSRGGTYVRNVLEANDRMAVLTQGTGCGTGQQAGCGDDSGATAVLINGDDNTFGHNQVRGSNAFSYDYGRDGSAFEVFNGNRNLVHDNVSVDNLVLSEIGRSPDGTADGNVFRDNEVSARCGAHCARAGGIVLRGALSPYGPNLDTVIDGNEFDLVGPQTQAVVCHAGCPSSTVITDNVLSARRPLWIDGQGWTVRDNVVQAQPG